MAAPLVFISYSRADTGWKDRLVQQLEVVEQLGRLEVWQDLGIDTGEDWQQSIVEAIGRARLAVLLVTQSFLDSDFIQNDEVPLLLERRRTGRLLVIPVIVGDCPWQNVDWLRKIQCWPKNGVPLDGLPRDTTEAMLSVLVQEIARKSARAGWRRFLFGARRLRVALVTALALGVAWAASRIPPTPSPPQVRSEAYRDNLTKGQAALQRLDGTKADQLLARALKEGDFPEAHAARAEALLLLGDEAGARREATKAAAEIESQPANDPDRLLAQARSDRVLGNWDRARIELQKLDASGNVDVAVSLAEVKLAQATEPADTDQVLDLVKKAQRTFADPRLDLVEAQANWMLSRFVEQERAASRAIEKSGDRPFVRAKAFLLRGMARHAQTRKGEAQDDFEEAKRLAQDNLSLKAEILDTEAGLHLQARDYDKARKAYIEERADLKLRGEVNPIQVVDINLATIHMRLGELAEAGKILKELEKTGPSDTLWLIHNNLGLVLAYQGALDEASGHFRTSLQLANNPETKAKALCNLAWVQGQQLSLQLESSKACSDAAGNDPRLASMAQVVRGTLLALGGEPDKARPILSDALKQQRALGDLETAGESLLFLARVDLASGRSDDARKEAEEASTLLKDGSPDFRATAQIVQARAALKLGRVGEASALLGKAGEQAGRSEHIAVRVLYRLVDAELAERVGNVTEAQKLIAAAYQEVKGRHPLFEIDCEVAAGALALRRQGDRNLLVRARKQADDHGYALAVAEVDRLLASP